MNQHRFWMEIVVLATLIACGLALLLGSLGIAAAAAVSEVGRNQEGSSLEQRSYEGMVTCSRCGAKHSAAMGRSATTCARVCVHSGASFELVEPESTYLLEGDSASLARVAGERVRITGSLSGNTIRVATIVAESS